MRKTHLESHLNLWRKHLRKSQKVLKIIILPKSTNSIIFLKQISHKSSITRVVIFVLNLSANQQQFLMYYHAGISFIGFVCKMILYDYNLKIQTQFVQNAISYILLLKSNFKKFCKLLTKTNQFNQITTSIKFRKIQDPHHKHHQLYHGKFLFKT